MIDSEEMNIFWEPWTSPPKTRKKKKSKKDRKQKNNQSNKTDGSTEKKKKKKSSKFSEPAETKKVKRKGKKKKSALDLDGESVVSVKRRCTENPETQDSKKETKKKKKVAFDLSPGHTHVKAPKCVFCSLQSPDENTGAAGGGGNQSQVTATDQNQSQPVKDDSQCPSDDMQSQDLFITQRTFRSPISQTSSSESSDKGAFATPTQRHKHTSDVKIASQDLCFYPRKATPKKNTLEALFSQEEDDDKVFQTQKESDTKHTKYKPASRHMSIKPKPVNRFLDAPTVVDDAKSKRPSTVSSAFTQTENFFTTELSSYLSFCQKNRRSAHSEDVTPLDLSLPNRVRKDHDRGLETSVIEIEDDQDRCFKSSQESHLKDVGGGGESLSGRLSSGSVQGKGQKTASSQLESESKSAETTGSSEDNDAPCRHNKLDLMQFQVRTVQTRLNESFYFKLKGEGYSPRPASPLMKLTQGRDLKSKKRN